MLYTLQGHISMKINKSTIKMQELEQFFGQCNPTKVQERHDTVSVDSDMSISEETLQVFNQYMVNNMAKEDQSHLANTLQRIQKTFEASQRGVFYGQMA